MAPGKTSKLDFAWATRAAGGGVTERRYQDLVVDGLALSSVFKADIISPFGWGPVDVQTAAVDRLLGRAVPDFADGRVSLHVCPECGDLGCGAISLSIETKDEKVIWSDFGYQNNYEDTVHRAGYETLGPFCFDRPAYRSRLEQLRRDLSGGGV